MKVHLQKRAHVIAEYADEAEESWHENRLVPYLIRSCDSLMVSVDKKETLTDKRELVTCKRCQKMIN